ncbi:MAG: hypothetical protein M5U09_16310 [Gammaproteobacteria bacterium]|nr:hypothetical protein [Gammaproteobacteria bacterium]
MHRVGDGGHVDEDAEHAARGDRARPQQDGNQDAAGYQKEQRAQQAIPDADDQVVKEQPGEDPAADHQPQQRLLEFGEVL